MIDRYTVSELVKNEILHDYQCLFDTCYQTFKSDVTPNTIPMKILTINILLTSAVMSATSFNSQIFDFSEAAFTNGAISGTTGYNIIDDSTGVKLAADNGDLDDLYIQVVSNTPQNAQGAIANAEFTSSGLVSNHGFGRTFADTYATSPGNNPGTVIKQTIRFTFANHISIENFTTDLRSLNSRGTTWEHTELAYLKKDGSYFTNEPNVGSYTDYEAANQTQPSWNIGSEGTGSASGSPSQGWFITGSTATVQDVGTNLTSIGPGNNGSKENFTGTNGNGILDYNDVGLAANTEIGGFEWTVYVEDTRGVDNRQSVWSATQLGFEISGQAGVVPEPSSTLLIGLGGLAVLLRRGR